jgi:hypothetical protein
MLYAHWKGKFLVDGEAYAKEGVGVAVVRMWGVGGDWRGGVFISGTRTSVGRECMQVIM